ncbi:MAG: hypothetical protein SFX18_04470 [Pirellulales bacterium]|nr:hypothetical protein [Pirellulales bacterium]
MSWQNRHGLWFLGMGLVALLMGGCGSAGETLATRQLEQVEKLVSITKTIQDDATAKKAIAELQPVMRAIRDTQAEFDKLDLSSEEKLKLRNKYQENPTLTVKLQQEAVRLGHLPLAEENVRTLVGLLLNKELSVTTTENGTPSAATGNEKSSAATVDGESSTPAGKAEKSE